MTHVPSPNLSLVIPVYLNPRAKRMDPRKETALPVGERFRVYRPAGAAAHLSRTGLHDDRAGARFHR